MTDEAAARVVEALWAIRNELCDLRETFIRVARCTRCRGTGKVESQCDGMSIMGICTMCNATGLKL